MSNHHKSKVRKLYILSDSANGTDSINGLYILIDDTGYPLYSHVCSSKGFAKGDLIINVPSRLKECTKKYGRGFRVLYLGEDDMTFEKLLELHDKNYGKVEQE